MQKLVFTIYCLISFLLFLPLAAQAETPRSNKDLLKLSLDELLDIKVTSVAKKEQKLADTAAAVFVISQEDIRRSGHRTLPELLRMVPGIEVANISASSWAVTSRGLNEEFARRLLVLIDGRSIYSPLFSGVYWDSHNPLLEDIDRIEVVRGPGGTLWGANAVNGVINVITKKAQDPQGGFLEAGAGSEEKGFGSLRYGGQFGKTTHYRGYVKYFNRDDFKFSDGSDGADEWDAAQGGFRIDTELTDKALFTFQGDFYDGNNGQTSSPLQSLTAPFTAVENQENTFSGGNLMARLEHDLSPTSDYIFQFYYDRAKRETSRFGQIIDTVDLDFQYRFEWSTNQEIVWGVGQRFVSDNLNGGLTTTLTPGTELNMVTSGFVQDEISLLEDRVRLTLGSKFEWNSYSGFEVQPSARALWNPAEKHTLWTAVSRAVRTPSRFETDARLNIAAFTSGPNTFLTSIFSKDDFQTEELLAYELGYRFKPISNVSLDVAAFYHDYDNLATVESIGSIFETTPSPAHTVLASQFDNQMEGEIFGVEVAAQWQVKDWWRIHSAFTWMEVELFLKSGSTDTVTESDEGNSPEIDFSIRSQMDLPYNLEFDAALYFVDELESLNIDSISRLDVRLGWKFSDDCDLSGVVQNIQDSSHLEFSGISGLTSTEVERGGYGLVRCKF
jgi:iron complex outermembrane receptor protein